MDDRNDRFQIIVMHALWIIILLLCGKRPIHRVADIRFEMIRFGDDYGNQSPEAPKYRREITFPAVDKIGVKPNER